MMASTRLQRWFLVMETYEYNLVVCSGSMKSNADCLSRLPLAQSLSGPHDYTN